MASVLSCIEDHSENFVQLTEAYIYLKDICTAQSGKKISVAELRRLFENSTQLSTVQTTWNESSSDLQLLNVNIESYDTSLKSVTQLVNHRRWSTHFGLALLGYWLLVVSMEIISNVIACCFPNFKMRVNGKIVGWIRKHLLIPHLITSPLNTNDKNFLLRFFINWAKALPPRIEAIVVLIYFLLTVVFSVLCYQRQSPNTIFPTRESELLILIADRCGIIAILQIPLLFAFAARNNLLIYFTGKNYRNFNLYHRLVSRIVWIMLLVHAALYVRYAIVNHNYKERWGLKKWRWANVSIICCSFAILVSFRPLRKRFYEFFKASHQLFALLFLIGAWNHCKTLGWMQPLYATVALWAYDHLVRCLKIILSGGVMMANCELILDRKALDNKVHSIRITITHSGAWRCFPGCYVYLYFLRASMFWQSHPFTLLEPTKIENGNQLVMLVKVKKGITEKLAQVLNQFPERTLAIPVLVEGPYNTPIPFRSYQNSIFVAGGIGITVIYTLALDLIKQYRAEMIRGEGNRRIDIIWITTTAENVECFANEMKALSETLFANITIYVTRELSYSKSVVDEATVDKTSGDIELGSLTPCDHLQSPAGSELSARQILTTDIFDGILPKIDVIFDRPNILSLVTGMIEEIDGTLAIVTCGPERMNRDMRKIAATAVGAPDNSRVDYFEEQLLW